MKKIMFNDRYMLTQAVLEGRKNQTRRILHHPKTFGGKYVSGFRLCTNREGIQFAYLVDEDEREIEGSVNTMSAYQIGEEVAVAQSYKEVCYSPSVQETIENELGMSAEDSAGWNNKMFVKADLMPHRIKITNIRVEHLQDISDYECLLEGIYETILDDEGGTGTRAYSYGDIDDDAEFDCFKSPREAFADIIDRVSGKGTWASNPYVFVYDFELVR